MATISAILKIFKRHLLPNRKLVWAETWWEALAQHTDSELLKSFRCDIQDGPPKMAILKFHQTLSTLNGKKRLKKSPGSATITNRSPSQTPRGRGNRQIQTSTNRTNVRKALRLALSSPSEVIAILKGLKNTRTNWHMERHTTNRLVE